MGKLDPSAQDRWWRNRIHKEESTYVDSAMKQASPREKVVLNTFGHAQVLPATAAESHLVGAAVLVKGSKPQQQSQPESAPMRLPVLGPSPGKASSIAGSRSRSSPQGRNDDTTSIASSYIPRQGGAHGSQASYPRTPQFSVAGSAVDAEIAERLATLERALKEEKHMREEAEKEMKELLVVARKVTGANS